MYRNVFKLSQNNNWLINKNKVKEFNFFSRNFEKNKEDACKYIKNAIDNFDVICIVAESKSAFCVQEQMFKKGVIITHKSQFGKIYRMYIIK